MNLAQTYRIIGVLLALSFSALAQTTPTGTLVGTVTDSAGAVVANARVELTNPATNEMRTTTTSAHGQYSFPALLPAEYRVKVSAPGFSSAALTVKVEVARAVHDYFLFNSNSTNH